MNRSVRERMGYICTALMTPLIGLALMTHPGQATATAYYVDQKHASASDNNPGTATLPWKSLYRAEKQLLQPGDIVYVKPGVYDASVGGNWDEPAINLATSGTATAPITLKALPRHGATVQGNGVAPALGSRGRNYVVIDGFVVTSTTPKGIAVFGTGQSSKVKGVVIKNNIVKGIHISHPTDNVDGVRLEDASGVVVSNNKIYDVRNGTMTWNAAGVKLYRVDNALIENNEIYGAAAGIYDKQGGTNNTFRRNYIHDCDVVGILFYTNDSYPSHNGTAYQNVINKCGKAIRVEQNGNAAIVDNVRVYNNTFVGYYGEGGVIPAKSNGVNYFYNNIYYRTSVPSVGDFITYCDPPVTIARQNYNLYVSAPRFMLGRYVTNRSFTTLASWQAATGFDKNSLAGDPAFVNAAGGNFKLNTWSIAIGAGRSDGTPLGTPVNIGAYPTGNEVIGIIPDTTVPAAPTLVSVI